MKERKKRIVGDLIAVRHVIKSPEWAIFRKHLASRLRALWSASVTAADDGDRLRHMAGAEALICFMRDFELEEIRLEKWLDFDGFESDSQEVSEAEAQMRQARGGPRPYRDEE